MRDEAKVYDYMLGDLPVINAHTSLGHVIETLDKLGLSGLPVIDDQHHIVGFVSEKDCIHQLLQSSYHCDDAPNTSEVMSTEVLSVSQNDSISKVADMMDRSTRKAYPVVHNNKLVGLITRGAVLRSLNDYLATCRLPSH